jgi:hypothetical protein
VALQRGAVIVDAGEHYRGNGKYHSRRRELTFRKDVVNETAVHAPIPVLKRMDINEAESRRRLEDRVQPLIAHPVVCVQQAAHQIAQVLGPCANELG